MTTERSPEESPPLPGGERAARLMSVSELGERAEPSPSKSGTPLPQPSPHWGEGVVLVRGVARGYVRWRLKIAAAALFLLAASGVVVLAAIQTVSEIEAALPAFPAPTAIPTSPIAVDRN